MIKIIQFYWKIINDVHFRTTSDAYNKVKPNPWHQITKENATSAKFSFLHIINWNITSWFNGDQVILEVEKYPSKKSVNSSRREY